MKLREGKTYLVNGKKMTFQGKAYYWFRMNEFDHTKEYYRGHKDNGYRLIDAKNAVIEQIDEPETRSL